MFHRRNAARVGLAACLFAAAAHPSLAAAQAGPGSGNGFLFGRPQGSVSFRGGFAQPNAGSDVFSFAHKQLTLGRGDFLGATFSGEIVDNIGDRTSLVFSAGYSGRKIDSEFRDLIDNNNLPIEQSTELRRVPLMVGVRYYLTSPGRSVGRLAYVPAKVVPYVTGGIGGMWYRFSQAGDFVDYKTMDVFNTEMVSSGWGPAAYGAAGVELAMGPKVAFTTEARYDAARAQMSRDFQGFNRIDLSGLSATVGFTFRY